MTAASSRDRSFNSFQYRRALSSLLTIFFTAMFVNPVTQGNAEAIQRRYTIVYATHKTGSTFLDQLFTKLAKDSGCCLIQLDTFVGGEYETVSGIRKLCPKGGILFGRKIPDIRVQRNMISALKVISPGNLRGIFQIRNPYDVAVSQFQSFTQNHVISPSLSEKEKEAVIEKRKIEHAAGVDAYAVNNFHQILSRLTLTRDFAAFAERNGFKVLISRYEDMTLTPESWARTLAQFLDLEPGSAAYQDLMLGASEENNITPDENTHTAYFLPGAHLKLLNKTTLNYLY